MAQVAGQRGQFRANEAEHDALQQEDHRLVDRVHLQPGGGGGEPGPAAPMIRPATITAVTPETRSAVPAT